jgi:hypothetical protein
MAGVVLLSLQFCGGALNLFYLCVFLFTWRREALHAQGHAETNLDYPSVMPCHALTLVFMPCRGLGRTKSKSTASHCLLLLWGRLTTINI